MSLWQIVGVSVTISDTGDLRSRDLLLIPKLSSVSFRFGKIDVGDRVAL